MTYYDQKFEKEICIYHPQVATAWYMYQQHTYIHFILHLNILKLVQQNNYYVQYIWDEFYTIYSAIVPDIFHGVWWR